MLTRTNVTNIGDPFIVNNGEHYYMYATSFDTEGFKVWKSEGNIFVGDCMPYHHNGVYHVLYLKDRHHHGSKWGTGHINGITSQQMIL